MWWIMLIIWSVVFIATLVIEFITADLDSIWFAVSAALVLVFAAIFQDLFPYWAQLIAFVGTSAVLLVATRPLTKKLMAREIIKTNSDRLIGMTGVVTETILPNDIGEVKIETALWRAVARDGSRFDVGEQIIVDSISGNKVVVSSPQSIENNEIKTL